jgi:hypothetical protein
LKFSNSWLTQYPINGNLLTKFVIKIISKKQELKLNLINKKEQLMSENLTKDDIKLLLMGSYTQNKLLNYIYELLKGGESFVYKYIHVSYYPKSQAGEIGTVQLQGEINQTLHGENISILTNELGKDGWRLISTKTLIKEGQLKGRLYIFEKRDIGGRSNRDFEETFPDERKRTLERQGTSIEAELYKAKIQEKVHFDRNISDFQRMMEDHIGELKLKEEDNFDFDTERLVRQVKDWFGMYKK